MGNMIKTEEEVRGAKLLHRDNSRFQFLFPNGKPELPKGLTGVLPVRTSYEMVKSRKASVERTA